MLDLNVVVIYEPLLLWPFNSITAYLGFCITEYAVFSRGMYEGLAKLCWHWWFDHREIA